MRFQLKLIAVLFGAGLLTFGCDGGFITDMDPSSEKSSDGATDDVSDPDTDGNPGVDGADASGGDDLSEACTEDAMIVCRQIAPGVFLELGVGRKSPGCKFPVFEDAAKYELCDGESLTDYISSPDAYADQKVAVSGIFTDWRNEPVPDCAKTEAFTGEPKIEDSYLVPSAEWGLGKNDQRLAVVAEDTGFLDTIKDTPKLTVRGTFRYKPIGKPCSDGSVLYKSGFIELPKEAMPPE